LSLPAISCVDCCKRSSNGLGCVIQPCYEIGALLFLIFGQSHHFPASSRRKISRWHQWGAGVQFLRPALDQTTFRIHRQTTAKTQTGH